MSKKLFIPAGMQQGPPPLVVPKEWDERGCLVIVFMGPGQVAYQKHMINASTNQIIAACDGVVDYCKFQREQVWFQVMIKQNQEMAGLQAIARGQGPMGPLKVE